MIGTPKCYTRECRHFIGVRQPEGDGVEIGEYVYCAAFPEGIPDDIAYGDNKHLEPVPDQGNNIAYERE